ncbi:MAG: CBS domain-containing protein [Sedimentisphaerales bacterium]|nr:CBS domain-containing protein [Sedimentisphaerales bacterium]
MFCVKDLTRGKIAYIDERWKVNEAADLLCSCDQVFLPVVDRNLDAVGIITEKDILNWVCNGRDKEAKVSECMRTEFATVENNVSLIELVYIFAKENHSQMLVVSKRHVIGLIKRSVVLKYLLDRRKAARQAALGT